MGQTDAMATYRLTPYGASAKDTGALAVSRCEGEPGSFSVAIAWRFNDAELPVIVFDERLTGEATDRLDDIAAWALVNATVAQDDGKPDDWSVEQYDRWREWRERHGEAVARLMIHS
jgi:hypothetical protein